MDTQFNAAVWGIHSEDDRLFLDKNIIGIGWNELGNLRDIKKSIDDFKDALYKEYTDAKPRAISNYSSMLYRFTYEMKMGDYVIFPSKKDRMINIGKIKSDYEYNKDNVKHKNGIMILHGVENLSYMESQYQNIILNILADEMENNKQVCTIIYGDREKLNRVLNNQKKLSNLLINLELEIDDLDIEKIYELTLSKLRKNIYVSSEVDKKIFNYIKSTYNQSEFKNMEYVNKLYNDIILNMNSKYSEKEKISLKSEDIPEVYNIKDLPTIMKDLNNLVGLKNIKEQVSDLVSLLKFNKKTSIDIKDFSFHMCFVGNPGTGKTTVARIITEILYNLGYIKQNKLTEVTAKDLIAGYVGQTSPKTFNVVNSALGGVLFIDEAYSITSGVNNRADFGSECISTLLKLMEDYRDRLIVIFAGYNEEMKQFLSTNPGLTSRIGYTIEFPDYSIEELIQIFLNLLHTNNMDITKAALEKVKEIIEISSKNQNFGNGRFIRNIFQKILIEHSKNIEEDNSDENLFFIDDILLITEKDINYEKLIFEGENSRKIGCRHIQITAETVCRKIIFPVMFFYILPCLFRKPCSGISSFMAKCVPQISADFLQPSFQIFYGNIFIKFLPGTAVFSEYLLRMKFIGAPDLYKFCKKFHKQKLILAW